MTSNAPRVVFAVHDGRDTHSARLAVSAQLNDARVSASGALRTCSTVRAPPFGWPGEDSDSRWLSLRLELLRASPARSPGPEPFACSTAPRFVMPVPTPPNFHGGVLRSSISELPRVLAPPALVSGGLRMHRCVSRSLVVYLFYSASGWKPSQCC